MKKLILLISTIILTNCDNTRHNEYKTCAWIKEHKKPIVCRPSAREFGGAEIWYTLISKDGQIYNTNAIIMNLPDTIK